MRAILTAFSYKGLINPVYIVNDLEMARQYLSLKLKLKEKNIFILTDIPQDQYMSLTGNRIKNYISISTRQEYVSELSNWFNSYTKCKLFLYFTGHAVPDNILVPEGNKYSLLSGRILSSLISNLNKNVDLLIILDCCYAESILSFRNRHTVNGIISSGSQHKIKSNVILLGSSLKKEKSGFHQENKCSLFSLHCFNFLRSLKKSTFLQLLNIGWRINRYRIRQRKERQNVCILTSGGDDFFPWLKD